MSFGVNMFRNCDFDKQRSHLYMQVVLGLGPWQNGKTCRSMRWGTRGQHFCCSTPSPGIISVTVNDRKSESEHVKVAYRSVRASNERVLKVKVRVSPEAEVIFGLSSPLDTQALQAET